MNRAIREWRKQFRGDAQVRDDVSITDEEIAESNLVLWGDPGSNKLLARIADKLPITWSAENVTLGGKRFASSTHVPVLVYPNPLNAQRYVVLNSGFTFREFDYLNNARQVPKLPDYAIVDTTTPPNDRWPGQDRRSRVLRREMGTESSAGAGYSIVARALAGWRGCRSLAG